MLVGADGVGSGAIVDCCPRGSGVGAILVLQALKGSRFSPPLELPIGSFSPSHFRAVASRELLCNVLFFLRPSSPRISHYVSYVNAACQHLSAERSC